MTPADAHAALRALSDAGRLTLGVNIRLMNSPGSPTFRRWESAVPIVAGIAASLAATSAGGWPLGAVVILAFAALWFGRLYPKVRDRVFDRTAELAFRGPAEFAALWQRGALSLQVGSEACESPRGDWIAFAATHADAARSVAPVPAAGPPQAAGTVAPS